MVSYKSYQWRCSGRGKLAGCLVKAQPLLAPPLPLTTAPLLAAQGDDLTDDWSLPSAYFVDS